MVLAACGEKPSEKAAAPSKPLVVGISLPLTGDFSQPGGEAKRGYEVWQTMVNAKGGVLGRKVELKITDDASNQDTVVADYTKLITQDKVDLLLGTFSSLLNYAASAVAEKNAMVFVEPAGGAPKMFGRGFKNLFFAQPATAPHQADVFVDWVKSLPASERPKTAAYPSQDDPFAAPVIESMQKQMEALGVKTVYSSVYPADTTNFQTIASKMANQRPDLIAQGTTSYGMQTFDQSLMKWFKDGQISYESALFYSTNPNELALRVSGVDSASDRTFDQPDKKADQAKSMDLTP